MSGVKRPQPETRRAYLDRVRAGAREGVPDAISSLAMLYEDGYRDERKRVLLRKRASRAVQLYRLAASLGDSSAMVNLAAILWGAGRHAEAIRLELKAARAGSALAAHNLGVSYRALGNHRRAVRWFRAAVELGDDSALFEVAKAELLGVGTARHPARALRALAVVARSDWVSLAENEEACILLARTYLDGWLVRRSVKKAAAWLRVVASRRECAQASAMLLDLES